MNNSQEAKITRDNSLCTFLVDNVEEYTGDVAFQAIATKTAADFVTTTKAAADAAANNTGFSIDKVIAKDGASIYACQLCASSQVKLDLDNNNVVSKSLNSTVSFYSNSSDSLSASRLQNVHDVMETNLAIITVDYLTAAQLVTLQTKITDYTKLSGTTTSVNTTSPVKTKALNTAIKVGAADVLNIKKLARKYLTSNPTFYENLMKVCKIPAITIRHTPVTLTVTESLTGTPLANAHSTLSKTTELGTGTDAGIVTYTNVSAGNAIATCAVEGYITGIRTVKIKRGKANAFFFVLVAGVMTTEMEVAITTQIDAFKAKEEAKRVLKVAKAKERKEAKAAKAKK